MPLVGLRIHPREARLLGLVKTATKTGAEEVRWRVGPFPETQHILRSWCVSGTLPADSAYSP